MFLFFLKESYNKSADDTYVSYNGLFKAVKSFMNPFELKKKR